VVKETLDTITTKETNQGAMERGENQIKSFQKPGTGKIIGARGGDDYGQCGGGSVGGLKKTTLETMDPRNWVNQGGEPPWGGESSEGGMAQKDWGGKYRQQTFGKGGANCQTEK